jgi:hypothetical protein
MAVNFQMIFEELAAGVEDLGYESGDEFGGEVVIFEVDGGYDSGFEDADWVNDAEDDGDGDDDEDEDEDENEDEDEEQDGEGEEDGPEEDWDFEIDWLCTVVELPFVD